MVASGSASIGSLKKTEPVQGLLKRGSSLRQRVEAINAAAAAAAAAQDTSGGGDEAAQV